MTEGWIYPWTTAVGQTVHHQSCSSSPWSLDQTSGGVSTSSHGQQAHVEAHSMDNQYEQTCMYWVWIWKRNRHVLKSSSNPSKRPLTKTCASYLLIHTWLVLLSCHAVTIFWILTIELYTYLLYSSI